MSWKSIIQNVANKFGYKVTRLPSIYLGQVDENSSLSQLINKHGADIVYHMATTGKGTDECMEKGCLPVLTHFYQPIPDLKDLERRGVWDKISDMRGIEWNLSKFLNNMSDTMKYTSECYWPSAESLNPMEFFNNNFSFGYCDAAILYCMIRKHKPKRLIEVGSGMSSRVIANALQTNMSENSSYDPEYTIIDPYSLIDISLFPKGTSLLKQQVEVTDLSTFEALSENDILFIDSSHVCKIGSDVNFEVLEVLPSLRSGVYVHFHDIVMPYEYPKIFATNPEFRMFWTEDYFLQAFLAFNSAYEVVLPVSYIFKNSYNKARSLFPMDVDNEAWGGCSLWLKCVKDSWRDNK